MKGALPALGIVAALATAATPPATGWVVVQKDGSHASFEAKPVLRSGKLVGKLTGSGTLVSIPAGRVDDEETRRANEAGGAARVPAAPAPARAPRPYETPPLGDRVRLKASGPEASRVLQFSRIGPPGRRGASPGTVEAAGERQAQGEGGPTDRRGRTEAWWRGRSAEVRGDFEDAAQALADADARLEAAERAWLGRSQAERNTFVLRVNEERAATERAREAYRRASAAWEALQDDARRSGALPGWLR